MGRDENLEYTVAKPEHKDAILTFLQKYFRVEEPISRAISLSESDAAPLFSEMVSEALESSVSVIVFDQKRNIAAVRLSKLIDLKAMRKSPPQSEDLSGLSPGGASIIGFLDRLEEGKQDLVPLHTCNKLLKFLMVSVHPEHYRKGIAMESIRLSMEWGRKLGATAVSVTATAHKSQALFRDKLGFRMLKVLEHEDFLDKDGKPVFVCDDGTHCGILLCSDIK